MPDPDLWLPSKIGRRTPDTRGLNEQHYLVPPFGEPLRLETRSGVSIVLGRDESCSLRVSSPTVSRRHVEIAFRGTPLRAFVKDLDTVNGTRLNGALVKGERPLQDRDMLRFGDVTAIYRMLKPGKSAADLVEVKASPERLNSTMPMETDEKIPRFGGEVSSFPMEELLGRLIALRATGTLKVEVDGVEGTVRFEKGHNKESRFSGHEGDAAFRMMAKLRRGRVWFEA